MVATVKTTVIQEPSSSTANMTLDTSGGVAFGQNLSVKGASSGTTTLAAQSVASGTVTIPAGTGTAAVQGVSTNIVSGTSQASTSGTAILFTGVPSWAKRVTINFNGVSTSGTSNILVQLGSVSVQTSGYLGAFSYTGNAAASGNIPTNGFMAASLVTAASLFHGSITISLLSSNIWTYTQTLARSDIPQIYFCGGSVSLSGALDRVNITTANGTDTFDAGSINILYE